MPPSPEASHFHGPLPIPWRFTTAYVLLVGFFLAVTGRPWRAAGVVDCAGAFQLDGKLYLFAGAAVPTLIAALAFRLLS